jgi:hypothetical protein
VDSTGLAAHGMDNGFNDGTLDYEGISFGSELDYPEKTSQFFILL